MRSLRALKGNCSKEDKQLAAELVPQGMDWQPVLSVLRNHPNFKYDVETLLNKTLEIVYAETANRAEADNIISRLYKMISQKSNDGSSSATKSL